MIPSVFACVVQFITPMQELIQVEGMPFNKRADTRELVKMVV